MNKDRKILKQKNVDIDNNNSLIKIKRRKSKFNFNYLNRKLYILLFLIIIGYLIFSTSINIKYKNLFEEVNRKIEEGDFSTDYSNVIDIVRKSLVTIGESKEDLQNNKYIEGNSTGVIVESTGKILVNYSKIKNMKEIYVKLPFVGSDPIKAEIRFTNEDMDMAIIKINYKYELTPISFASEVYNIPGKPVVLMGNVTANDYIDSIMPGVITSTNRYITENGKKYSLIESNIPINEINTGGIIVNLKGELIGIPSEKVTKIFNREGLYYAIDLTSLAMLSDYTNEMKEILGIYDCGFIDENIYGFGVGLQIVEVNKSKNPDGLGLQEGDILLQIDGEKITNSYLVLKNKRVGDTITYKIIRDKEIKDLTIQLK